MYHVCLTRSRSLVQASYVENGASITPRLWICPKGSCTYKLIINIHMSAPILVYTLLVFGVLCDAGWSFLLLGKQLGWGILVPKLAIGRQL